MFRTILLAGLLVVSAAFTVGAATIVIVNMDGPGEGFNDATPATPVGGNPGTTVGDQRLNVFNHAAGIWAALLPSAITIRVEARFNPQFCSSSSAVLGSAGPIDVFRDFAGAPVAATWYHVALANKLAGVDLSGSNDISATFNSNLNGNPSCLGGTGWYYGYDGNEGTDIELLPVVLHELGHGLGFSTLIGSSGAEFGGFQDIYETFIRDNTQGDTWNNLTQGQRATSAVNTGNGVTGDVVLVDDGTGTVTDACEPIINGGAVAGKIALIDRGSCSFVSKAQEAEAVGAIGVIIANNVAGATPITLGGSDPGIAIPVVSVTLDDGNAIKAQLGTGVNATLQLDTNQAAGTDTAGRVKLYAPDPYEGGSSISHWDVTALPNLLMEPAINDNLSSDVDLTLAHFADIGWLDELGTGVNGEPAPSRDVALLSNYPNPFNPSTRIRYELASTQTVELAIFDVRGRLVRSLHTGTKTQGLHETPWDGIDKRGTAVASGVYYVRLVGERETMTRKIVLLK
jgi:hypothetical protein